MCFPETTEHKPHYKRTKELLRLSCAEIFVSFSEAYSPLEATNFHIGGCHKSNFYMASLSILSHNFNTNEQPLISAKTLHVLYKNITGTSPAKKNTSSKKYTQSKYYAVPLHQVVVVNRPPPPMRFS
jgi:hypothetical protein